MSYLSQFIRRAAVLLAVSSSLLSQRAFAQTSVSVGAAGQLTATRILDTSSSFVTQSLSPSAGVFATFQQSFRPWLGYSVNLGYTRATYRYTGGEPGTTAGLAGKIYIPNNIYETSVSYIARKRLTDRLTAFGEAGAGAITFASITRDIHSSPGYDFGIFKSDTYRPEGIAGFGIDYRLAHGLGLRAEYRALFFKYPDYASQSVRQSTVNSAPTLSVTYTFGKHPKR